MSKKVPKVYERTDFPGFASKYGHDFSSEQFVMYPMILTEYWCYMTPAEQKVLDFLIRQTIGWGKSSDIISWSQFANGLGGKSRGGGTGLSVSTIRTAADGLEKKGFIKITRRDTRPCIFHLVLRQSLPVDSKDDEDFDVDDNEIEL